MGVSLFLFIDQADQLGIKLCQTLTKMLILIKERSNEYILKKVLA